MKEIIYSRRTSFVRTGGRHFKYCTYSVISKKQHLCLGIGKSKNFNEAINKSFKYNPKNLIKPTIINHTIPRPLKTKICKTTLEIMPCLDSKGVIANNIIRTILNHTYIKNIYSKIIGSKNKINVIKATFKLLKKINQNEQKKNR